MVKTSGCAKLYVQERNEFPSSVTFFAGEFVDEVAFPSPSNTHHDNHAD